MNTSPTHPVIRQAKANGPGLSGAAWRLVAKLRRGQPPVGVTTGIRLTIVQNGDYAEAFDRLAAGGEENYYAQKYSVDFVGSLMERSDVEAVTVITCNADSPPRDLPNGVTTRCLKLFAPGPGQAERHQQLLQHVIDSEPTHLIAATPVMGVLKWAVNQGLPVLPCLADSFRTPGLKKAVRARQLAWLLDDPGIEMVANHNLAASLELVRIGVRPSKVVPYDWPAVISPQDHPVKAAPVGDKPFGLLYIGKISEDKGLGDVIDAVALLEQRGVAVTLTVMGNGDLDMFRSRARDAGNGVADRINFVGGQPRSAVFQGLRDADAVVVPSRHDYPEGLPLTIYETLCSRTPLIASDHPMFALRVQHERNALVFPQRDAEALAGCIQRLASDGPLYEKLSQASQGAAEHYLVPVKIDQLYTAFLDPSLRQQLVAEHALSSGHYAAWPS